MDEIQTHRHSVEPKKVQQTEGETYCVIPLVQCPRPDQINPWCRSQAHASLWKGWGRAWNGLPGELLEELVVFSFWSGGWVAERVHVMKSNPFQLQDWCPSIMYDTPQFLYKCDDTIPVEIFQGHAELDRGGKSLHSEGAAWISQRLLAGVTWDTISGRLIEGIRTEDWISKNSSNWGTFLEHRV